MQSFKKCLIKSLAFLLSIIIIGSPFFGAYIFCGTRNNFPHQTKADLKKHEGTIDKMLIGASLGHQSMVPEIFDKQLNCNSFNFCSDGISVSARYYMINKHLTNNPIDTIIMDVSYDTMTRVENGTIDSKMRILEKLETTKERFEFIFSCCEIDDFPPGIYYALAAGNVTIKNTIKEKLLHKDIYNGREYIDKGYISVANCRKLITQEEYTENYHSEQLPTKILETHAEYMEKIIELCKENNIRLILVSTPVSRYFTERYDNNDEVYDYYKKLSNDYNLEYYNFNLLKNKDELFSEKTSFMDDTHMTATAALTFSEELCRIINETNEGKDISHFFYNNFLDAEKNK